MFEYTFLIANMLPASTGAALECHLYLYVCHTSLPYKQAVTMATVIITVGCCFVTHQQSDWQTQASLAHYTSTGLH